MPYLQTPFDKRQGQFSPDGHWIAYTSDESGAGQYQIYVQSFPAGPASFRCPQAPAARSRGGAGMERKSFT